MGFGLSRSTTRTLMLGADPTIAWVDSTTSEPQAIDYHLSSYSQVKQWLCVIISTLHIDSVCCFDCSVVLV